MGHEWRNRATFVQARRPSRRPMDPASRQSRTLVSARQCLGVAAPGGSFLGPLLFTAAATEHDREISRMGSFQAMIRNVNSCRGCSRWLFEKFNPGSSDSVCNKASLPRASYP